MSQAVEVGQNANMVDIGYIFWILGLMVSAGVGGITVFVWFNRQLSQTRAQLYTRIYKDAAVTEGKIKEQSTIAYENKERLGLLELSNRHQESRLDGLDEKIDNVQSEVTATKDKVVEMNLTMAQNQLVVIGEVRAIGDKFAAATDRLAADINRMGSSRP